MGAFFAHTLSAHRAGLCASSFNHELTLDKAFCPDHILSYHKTGAETSGRERSSFPEHNEGAALHTLDQDAVFGERGRDAWGGAI